LIGLSGFSGGMGLTTAPGLLGAMGRLTVGFGNALLKVLHQRGGTQAAIGSLMLSCLSNSQRVIP